MMNNFVKAPVEAVKIGQKFSGLTVTPDNWQSIASAYNFIASSYEESAEAVAEIQEMYTVDPSCGFALTEDSSGHLARFFNQNYYVRLTPEEILEIEDDEFSALLAENPTMPTLDWFKGYASEGYAPSTVND